MFETACIPMIIQRATLKREMDNDESYRVADLSLLIEPFGHGLAGELGAHIQAHLFADDAMRPEVEKATLGLRVPDQRVIVASAPDAPTLTELQSVSIGSLVVSRRETEDRAWYRAVIEARIDLRERAVREFLFHHFGELRVFTFYPEQTGLAFDGAREAADNLRNLAKRDGTTMTLTDSTTGKGVRFNQDGSVEQTH